MLTTCFICALEVEIIQSNENHMITPRQNTIKLWDNIPKAVRFNDYEVAGLRAHL
jgi:hypothetical protein